MSLLKWKMVKLFQLKTKLADMKYVKYLLFLSIFLLAFSCSSEKSTLHVSQNDIVKSFAIEYLADDTYYFPALRTSEASVKYQPLKRFDLIFVGHDIQDQENTIDIASSIPGYYTHVLSYIGKDSDGFAYAVEMNADENMSFTLDFNGLKVGGKFSVFCLGNDYGKDACPKDEYPYGIETYDHMQAKRLKPELRTELMIHEKQLMATMKEDLILKFPFQLPIHFGPETRLTKVIPLVDDGRKNGADCADYFVSLFEEIAGVCMDDIRINASTLEAYYLNDPVGQKAFLPAKFNIFTEGDIYFKTLLSKEGYSIVDNLARETLCSDRRIVSGIPTPDLLFNSPSMVDVEGVE